MIVSCGFPNLGSIIVSRACGPHISESRGLWEDNKHDLMYSRDRVSWILSLVIRPRSPKDLGGWDNIQAVRSRSNKVLPPQLQSSFGGWG